MASYNRVVLMGNLTRDVDVRYLQSGMAVTDVGLAVNDRRKNQSGEWIDETTFVDITLWGRTAEVAGEYLSKGSPVLIDSHKHKLSLGDLDGFAVVHRVDPDLDHDTHGTAPYLQDIRITGHHGANVNRGQERHAVNRDRGHPPAGDVPGGNTPGEIHL